MNIQPFFDPNTFTLTYVVYDLQTRDAIVIDPVLDYVPVGSKVATDSYQQVKSFLMNICIYVFYKCMNNMIAYLITYLLKKKLYISKSSSIYNKEIQKINYKMSGKLKNL